MGMEQSGMQPCQTDDKTCISDGKMIKAEFPNYLPTRSYSIINSIKKIEESDIFLP